MASEAKAPKLITIRPTDQDWRILQRLMKRMGINASNVIRIALRKLDQSETKQ